MEIVLAIAIMALGAIVLGAALGFASIKFKVEGNPLVEKIEGILPQTQCGQCGFPGCKPYAEAIAKGEADINKCPPGGAEGVQRLADLLGREFKPLSAEHGVEKPKSVAFIDEDLCIGCTLCIQACPVDAIVGAAKQMHTIVAAMCTGCELCLPPCPVECIRMGPIAENLDNWKWKYPLVEIRAAPDLALPPPPLELTISLAKRQLARNEEVTIEYRLVNSGPEPVTVTRRPLLVCVQTIDDGGQYGYREGAGEAREDFVTIAPGESVAYADERASLAYELGQGTCRVRARYVAMGRALGLHAWRGTLVSNGVAYRVVAGP